jgi:hypothetical protein
MDLRKESSSVHQYDAVRHAVMEFTSSTCVMSGVMTVVIVLGVFEILVLYL